MEPRLLHAAQNIEPIHALSGELLGAFGAVLREWDDKSSRLGAVFLQYVPYLLIYSGSP